MRRTTPVKRFAICGGAGTSYWKAAMEKGIDVLVTGDMKHHEALDSSLAGVTVVDVGHYHSEKIYMKILAKAINKHFSVEYMLAEEDAPIITL
jgi:putative NIF3 family GTP cyclohydrolase 1 type 2